MAAPGEADRIKIGLPARMAEITSRRRRELGRLATIERTSRVPRTEGSSQ